MRPWLGAVRIVVPALAVALVGVVLAAEPAGAHGPGGLQATNYRTRIVGLDPAVPGVRIRATDLGANLELTNTTSHDVVVLGYDDEPYLRVGPRGVFENTRSPARYLNRNVQATTPVPRSADPHARPHWHRIDDGVVARWHDHRAHWMGSQDPPTVQRAPDAPHLVQRFTITLRTGAQKIRVLGVVRWVPGPSPWPWIGAALALALVGFVLAMTRRSRPVLIVVVSAVVLSEVLHLAGGWGASTAGVGPRLFADVYLLLGIGAGVGALIALTRRGVDSATAYLLFAGLLLAAGGALSDVGSFGHSQLPTTLSPTLDRLGLTVILGGGIALTAVAVRHLLRPQPRRVHRPASAGPPNDEILAALRARSSAPR